MPHIIGDGYYAESKEEYEEFMKKIRKREEKAQEFKSNMIKTIEKTCFKEDKHATHKRDR